VTVTARDLVNDALNMLGVYDSASPMTDADAEFGLKKLNQLMDMWSNMSLACYSVLEQSAPLVAGQASYTIGPGGNFNMVRPISILTDPGTAYVQDSNGNNYPMSVVPRDKWNLYSNRSSIITSNFPNVLFYDPQFPLGVINITPYPNLAYTMFWDSYAQLSDFATLQVNLSLPPGYELAIVSNLAILMKSAFLDGPIDPTIPAIASESLGTIKRMNARELLAVYDSEIVSRGQVSYNPYTDSVGSVVPA
jgi:hypothetical protein